LILRIIRKHIDFTYYTKENSTVDSRVRAKTAYVVVYLYWYSYLQQPTLLNDIKQNSSWESSSSSASPRKVRFYRTWKERTTFRA